MKKNNKKGEKVETRKSYRFKKKLHKIKRDAILIFVGFGIGILYYAILIDNDVKAEEVAFVEKEEVKEEIKEEVEEVKEEAICYLDEVSCKIKEVSDEYNVDWKLTVAIAKHETWNYTSEAFLYRNNVGGNYGNQYGSYQLLTFDSLEDGIDYFVNHLKVEYIDIGLDTIEEIQPIYAPEGVENDPNNLNSHWVSGVTKYYNELRSE